jgi:hypothetical protein
LRQSQMAQRKIRHSVRDSGSACNEGDGMNQLVPLAANTTPALIAGAGARARRSASSNSSRPTSATATPAAPMRRRSASSWRGARTAACRRIRRGKSRQTELNFCYLEPAESFFAVTCQSGGEPSGMLMRLQVQRAPTAPCLACRGRARSRDARSAACSVGVRLRAGHRAFKSFDICARGQGVTCSRGKGLQKAARLTREDKLAKPHSQSS